MEIGPITIYLMNSGANGTHKIQRKLYSVRHYKEICYIKIK